MTKEEFLALRRRVIEAGYREEIVWQESLPPCDNAESFFAEYTWVVISAGMKNQVAQQIYDRVRGTLRLNHSAYSAFKHLGKSNAIDLMWHTYRHRFQEYQKAPDKLVFLKSLPWIGDITKYHLAKNLGMDVAKPDRHLARIAALSNETPQSLCERLSNETGYRIATVDLIIWRAANLKMI